jgi:hypothetical protein
LNEETFEIQFIGRAGGVVGIRVEDIPCPRERVNDATTNHLTLHRMEAEFERSDNTEIASTTSDSPKQVGILVWACMLKSTVGCHDVRSHYVVHGESESTGDTTKSPTRNQAAHTGM